MKIAKHPLTSKILLSAVALAGASAPMVQPFLDNAEAIKAAIGTMLPVQYLPIFNIVAAGLIAAFRVWSSGSRVSMSGEKRLGE